MFYAMHDLNLYMDLRHTWSDLCLCLTSDRALQHKLNGS